MKALRKCKPLP